MLKSASSTSIVLRVDSVKSPTPSSSLSALMLTASDALNEPSRVISSLASKLNPEEATNSPEAARNKILSSDVKEGVLLNTIRSSSSPELSLSAINSIPPTVVVILESMLIPLSASTFNFLKLLDVVPKATFALFSVATIVTVSLILALFVEEISFTLTLPDSLSPINRLAAERLVNSSLEIDRP